MSTEATWHKSRARRLVGARAVLAQERRKGWVWRIPALSGEDQMVARA
jgi:hypothetical protein